MQVSVTDSSLSISLSLSDSRLKEPVEINLNDQEAFTACSFLENYREAQAVGMPYYLLALAIFEDGHHQCYDAIWLRCHKISCLNKDEEYFCPLTRQIIEKVHYIALECLNIEQGVISANTSETIKFKEFFPKRYDCEEDENIALDALNYVVLGGNFSQQEKDHVKACQALVLAECQRGLAELTKCVEALEARPLIKLSHIENLYKREIKSFKNKLTVLYNEAAKWGFANNSPCR